MRYTVGCVPYLNARPLVYNLGELEVDVLYDVPSRLPMLLEDRRASAILVSSIEALQRPNVSVAANVSISSIGEVLSVRLFSRVPFESIKSLALDQSSMTSNALARIILAERYGVRPVCSLEPPDLRAMLRMCDAAVLIGDNGMRADPVGLYVLDLGQAWNDLIGLPFVWAMWIGGDDLTPDLADRLQRARQEGSRRLEQIIDKEVADGRWEYSLCRRYLAEVMNYELGPDHLRGLEEFARLLIQHEIVKQTSEPAIVSSELVGH